MSDYTKSDRDAANHLIGKRIASVEFGGKNPQEDINWLSLVCEDGTRISFFPWSRFHGETTGLDVAQED